MKKNVIAAAAASLFVVPFAFAVPTPIPIQVDLGPSGVVVAPQVVSFPAPDVQFQGQNIAIDFTFQNSEFIRRFTQTKLFDIDVLLGINNAPSPQVFVGTGYVSDTLDTALGPPASLQAFPVTNGANQIVGTDFFFTPLISNVAPVDIFHIHLNLTLPDSSNFGFANDTFSATTVDGNIFGIGPGVPVDIVPDAGSTLLLLGISLMGLMEARIWGTSVS